MHWSEEGCYKAREDGAEASQQAYLVAWWVLNVQTREAVGTIHRCASHLVLSLKAAAAAVRAGVQPARGHAGGGRAESAQGRGAQEAPLAGDCSGRGEPSRAQVRRGQQTCTTHWTTSCHLSNPCLMSFWVFCEANTIMCGSLRKALKLYEVALATVDRSLMLGKRWTLFILRRHLLRLAECASLVWHVRIIDCCTAWWHALRVRNEMAQ
jgi:hypothetical protein